jgi:hypothetical protein
MSILKGSKIEKNSTGENQPMTEGKLEQKF